MRQEALRVRIFACGVFSLALGGAFPPVCQAAEPEGNVARGEVSYVPPANEAQVPERFRLPAHQFAYELRPLEADFGSVRVSRLTFPSPVKTPYEANNTVHCEYFAPRGSQRGPGVVVLHILGGDFPLARFCAGTLAQKGVAALFVKMPYYGPRRPPEVARRMVSADPAETVEGMTQAVLDIRRATAWLATREEVDGERLGAFGISLGGITAALATANEPRLRQACLVLAGGDIGRVAWDSPEVAAARRRWEAMGGTREQFAAALAPIDPVAYAANARDRRILMINAKSDEVIPRACTESLWEAFGRQEIVWYEGTHYTAARHLLDGLHRASSFFHGGQEK